MCNVFNKMVKIKKNLVLSIFAIPFLLGTLYLARETIRALQRNIWQRENLAVHMQLKEMFQPEKYVPLPNTKELDKIMNSEKGIILIKSNYCGP